MTVGALEAACRWLNVDFEFKAHAYNTVPIFFRPPLVPVGTAFFRRPGPDRWEGKPLRQMYRMAGGTGHQYDDEPDVSIRYDALGFRNPESLDDWEIVVVGDSFTELGYLPFEDLFTTRLGEALGVRVKNLGISLSGTFAQTFYLAEWGKAPSTRDAVLVFFEGNDFSDMRGERAGLDAAAADEGMHPRRVSLPVRSVSLAPQNSLVTAVYRLFTRKKPEEPVGMLRRRDADRVDAYFSRNGTNIPVTFELMMPANVDPFLPARVELTNDAIHGWAVTASKLGLRPWLVFMPTKRRVLDGYLVWSKEARAFPLPNGVPELIQRIATSNGVRFVDATAALRHETEAGRLTYNAVGDSHLNRLGSMTVARVIADAMSPDVGR